MSPILHAQRPAAIQTIGLVIAIQLDITIRVGVRKRTLILLL